MHLTTTLEFGDSIQPITLSQETDISVWANATGCYISGWGRSKCDHSFKVYTKGIIDHTSINEEISFYGCMISVDKGNENKSKLSRQKDRQ